jgi:hypothetical protein
VAELLEFPVVVAVELADYQPKEAA